MPLCAAVVFPVALAFDQSLRFGLMHGWITANLFTAFVLRPALTYLAARSLIRWLRIDWRGFGALLAPAVAIDAATFKVPLEQAVIAAGLTGVTLLVAEVSIERVPEPKQAGKPLDA